jgi:osmotically-inducible protein OsmY
LICNPYIDAHEIVVEVHNGDVTLTGEVDSRQTKYFAEEIVVSVSGAQDIQNQLRVAGRRQRPVANFWRTEKERH